MKTDFPADFAFDAQKELRRIGVDERRLALMISGGISPADFLRWLQTIPGGIGHDAFLARAHAPAARGGPHVPSPDELPAPDVSTYSDPEIDEQKAFRAELNRVLPSSDHPNGYAFDMPHGRKHALEVLRSLSDRAGIDAFVRALKAAPPPAPEDPMGSGAGA